MEYKGTIKRIMDTIKISDKFRKREFVVSDDSPQYPQTVQFETANDKCDLLDNFKEGDEVKIDFQIRGREWTNPQGEIKCFNTLSAFRIFPAKTESTRPEPTKPKSNTLPVQKPQVSPPTPDDDLPF